MTIDIRAAIEQIAPGAAWRWLGGDWGDYNNLVWDDETIKKPTLEELQTAWQAIQQKESTRENLKNTIKNTVQGAVGQRIDQLSNDQIKALLVVLLWRIGAISDDAKIKPLSEWFE